MIGGILHYEHGFAENIYDYDSLKDKKFDLVFMGQVIEHIEKDKLSLVLKWIREHLAKDGRFIFDTPNRLLTKIQSFDSFIDPDHKYEYEPDELKKIIEDNGFKVIKENGILDMPNTLKTKVFDPLEVLKTEYFNNNPQTSYLFAFETIVKD